eukprot:TRINITY_DN13280_c0_g1_i1.p3 TRINITY_DN13280_c0_g1~~TRINITY_DN13280_c0_g1_i1.p3  ORF type:complete len:230 (-),score=0.55 TRINITY_DN13280_c0_g1_i1:235-828(-)
MLKSIKAYLVVQDIAPPKAKNFNADEGTLKTIAKHTAGIAEKIAFSKYLIIISSIYQPFTFSKAKAKIIPIDVAILSKSACIHRPQPIDKQPFTASSTELTKGKPGASKITLADITIFGVVLRLKVSDKLAIKVATNAVVIKLIIKTNFFLARTCLIYMPTLAARKVIIKPFISLPQRQAKQAQDKPTIKTTSHLLQ